MAEPIKNLLKSAKQLALAELQDSIILAIYEIDKDVVLHGGTAIWRCYGGKRFSEDVDYYLTERQVKKFASELTWALSRHQVKMEYPKFSVRVVDVFNDFARTKMEGMVMEGVRHPIQRNYETIDGSKMLVKTLSAEEFILEKIRVYGKREYARDLYDIYQLVEMKKPTAKAKMALSKFIKNISKPKDLSVLSELVYVGVPPSFETMVEGIKEGLK